MTNQHEITSPSSGFLPLRQVEMPDVDVPFAVRLFFLRFQYPLSLTNPALYVWVKVKRDREKQKCYLHNNINMGLLLISKCVSCIQNLSSLRNTSPGYD